MSLDKFDNSCRGCRPALLDVHTGKTIPDDHPTMVTIIKIWDEQISQETKRAWHSVTCQNSQDPTDLAKAREFVDLIESACNQN